MITGNKGEWSEIYVLLRLLSNGRIYAADENAQINLSMYFPILKIFRDEQNKKQYEYIIKNEIQVLLNDNLVKEIDRNELDQEADFLYQKILEGSDRAFSIERTEQFMNNIGCTRLAAPSTDKTDIKMQIHDIQTGYEPICGFSIKSEVGNPPTLLNATGATNFIFEVTGLSDRQISEINAIETRTKIKDRMERIFNQAQDVIFFKSSSDVFNRNLMLIDSKLPELIATSLIYHYRYGLTTCSEIVKNMELDNPLNFPSSGFYTYKFKKLLCSIALGMTPARIWDGTDEANGGYIIVSSSGDVLAYHIYNRDYFENYLLNQTKYERASTTRHGFASLYKENNKTYLKLNLQIRFI